MAERGYALARGDRRDFVLVDRNGEFYSLPRFAGVKTKDVRARLGDGTDLPSIEQVLAHWVQERYSKPVQELTPQEALGRVTRHHAAFTRDMMERTLKPVIADEIKRLAVMESILQSDKILKIGTHNGRDVYTSPEMIALERRMVDWCFAPFSSC